jgi:hypothetical protein
LMREVEAGDQLEIDDLVVLERGLGVRSGAWGRDGLGG